MKLSHNVQRFYQIIFIHAILPVEKEAFEFQT